MAAPGEALIVFVKHPEPGRVKTRLAPLLGDRQAARVYRRLAARTLEAASAASQPRRSVRVWVEPASRVPCAPSWLGPADAFLAQPEGDLGARMDFAFNEAFAAGASRVVILGSDLPGLSSADIDDAFSALGTRDAVLGPAADGGYWLLGLRRPAPALFSSMPWSSGEVLGETRRRLAGAGLAFLELRELADIDRPEDFIAHAGSIPCADIDRWATRDQT